MPLLNETSIKTLHDYFLKYDPNTNKAGMRKERAANTFVKAMEKTRAIDVLSTAYAEIDPHITNVSTGSAEIQVGLSVGKDAENCRPLTATLDNTRLHVYTYDSGTGELGKEIAQESIHDAGNGTFSVDLPEAGTRIIAYAEVGGRNSGLVWKDLQAGKVMQPVTGASTVWAPNGRYNPVTFYAYHDIAKDGATSREAADAVFASGVKLVKSPLKYAPDYFSYPGPTDLNKEQVYKLGEKYVVIDRDMEFVTGKGEATKDVTLAKGDLVGMAKEGVVAIKLPISGGKWVTLDGSPLAETQISKLEAGKVKTEAGELESLISPDSKPLKMQVLSFNDKPNMPHAGNIFALPNSIVVESKDDISLAEEHIFARVDVSPKDKDKAVVTRFDGVILGEIDIGIVKPAKGDTEEEANAQHIRREVMKLNNLYITHPRGDKPSDPAIPGSFEYKVYFPNIMGGDKMDWFVYTDADFIYARESAKSKR